MDAGIAGRIMRKGWQRFAIRLRDIGDSATDHGKAAVVERSPLAWPEFEVPVATRFEQDCGVCSKKRWPVLEAGSHSGKPCGVFSLLMRPANDKFHRSVTCGHDGSRRQRLTLIASADPRQAPRELGSADWFESSLEAPLKPTKSVTCRIGVSLSA